MKRERRNKENDDGKKKSAKENMEKEEIFGGNVKWTSVHPPLEL